MAIFVILLIYKGVSAMYYNSLNAYLRNKFGCKVYKLSISSGLSCPNRDGNISMGGCNTLRILLYKLVKW